MMIALVCYCPYSIKDKEAKHATSVKSEWIICLVLKSTTSIAQLVMGFQKDGPNPIRSAQFEDKALI
jgi:hypothetical protein